jgi:hypothetical protein
MRKKRRKGSAKSEMDKYESEPCPGDRSVTGLRNPLPLLRFSDREGRTSPSRRAAVGLERARVRAVRGAKLLFLPGDAEGGEELLLPGKPDRGRPGHLADSLLRSNDPLGSERTDRSLASRDEHPRIERLRGRAHSHSRPGPAERERPRRRSTRARRARRAALRTLRASLGLPDLS